MWAIHLKMSRDSRIFFWLSVRASDFIARLGGDEFVVVIEDLEVIQVMHQLGVVLQRMHREVEYPFDLREGRLAEVDMSMGLALYPLDAEDTDALLRLADSAMCQVKTHKDDRLQWWSLSSTQCEVIGGQPK